MRILRGITRSTNQSLRQRKEPDAAKAEEKAAKYEKEAADYDRQAARKIDSLSQAKRNSSERSLVNPALERSK